MSHSTAKPRDLKNVLDEIDAVLQIHIAQIEAGKVTAEVTQILALKLRLYGLRNSLEFSAPECQPKRWLDAENIISDHCAAIMPRPEWALAVCAIWRGERDQRAQLEATR